MRFGNHADARNEKKPYTFIFSHGSFVPEHSTKVICPTVVMELINAGAIFMYIRVIRVLLFPVLKCKQGFDRPVHIP